MSSSSNLNNWHFIILLGFFITMPLPAVHAVTSISTLFSTDSFDFSPFRFFSGFRVNDFLPEGFQLVSSNQLVLKNIPGRFRVSRDSIADSLILISQWANYPEVPQPLPAFEVPNGFRVIETESGRLYIQTSTSEFDVAGSSFYVERQSSATSRITVSASTTTTNTGTNSISPGSGRTSFSSLTTVSSGFGLFNQNNAERFSLSSSSQQRNDLPGRLRVSTDSADSNSMVRISEWDNYPEVPAQLQSFDVPNANGLTVTRDSSSGRLHILVQDDQREYDVPGTSFYVERLPDQVARITFSGTTPTTASNTGTNTGTQVLPSNPPTANRLQNLRRALRRDKTKSDGTTDCGPNIAYLCSLPTYASLMQDQCPETCERYGRSAAAPPAAAAAGIAPSVQQQQQVVAPAQPAAPSALSSIFTNPLVIFPRIFGGFGGCGRK